MTSLTIPVNKFKAASLFTYPRGSERYELQHVWYFPSERSGMLAATDGAAMVCIEAMCHEEGEVVGITGLPIPNFKSLRLALDDAVEVKVEQSDKECSWTFVGEHGMSQYVEDLTPQPPLFKHVLCMKHEVSSTSYMNFNCELMSKIDKASRMLSGKGSSFVSATFTKGGKCEGCGPMLIRCGYDMYAMVMPCVSVVERDLALPDFVSSALNYDCSPRASNVS